MITAAQSKMGRAGIGWSIQQLADAAHVGVATVARFETRKGETIPATLAAIQRALEAAGVEFLPDNGVRLPPAEAISAVSPGARPDDVSQLGTPMSRKKTSARSPGRAHQAAKTPPEAASSDYPAESGNSKPHRPRAKPLLISKEAQIRALRERDA